MGFRSETLDLSEVMGRIGRMKDDDPTRRQKLKAIQKYVSTSGDSAAALMKMAKLGAVVDEWMQRGRRARSARCSAGLHWRRISASCPAR